MNSVQALLERFAQLDVYLQIDGDKLKVNAPSGALTAELREELGRHKEDIREYLRASGANPVAAAPVFDVQSIRRVPRHDAMPLSHTQRRLWFVRQLDPASTLYNMPAYVRIAGPLDADALERTLQALIQRHEPLRTRFMSVNGEPRCAVDSAVQFHLPRADVSALPPEQREAEALRLLRAVVGKPFDLTQTPQLHALLIRAEADVHYCCIVFDHLTVDGLSLVILWRELGVLYEQFTSGVVASLPELPTQYLDYCEWERQDFARGAFDAHLEFWKQQLAGLPGLLSLPTDRPRPPVQTFAGGRWLEVVDPLLGQQLKLLARTQGATLFMVMLAAFQTVLHRYTSETDIAIGSAVGNRDRSEVANTVGFFANNLVLRGDVSGNPTVYELIARVRDMARKSYRHQAMPFDILVDTLTTQRNLDHSPLFQVMFVQHGGNTMAVEMPGVEVEVIPEFSNAARFDLAVDAFDMPSMLVLAFEYNADMFDASTIEGMARHYHRLLREFVASPEAPINSLPLLEASEAATIAGSFTAPATSVPLATVHSLFEEQVRRRPDAVAVRFLNESLTYRELNARANQLAHHLRTLGVGRDSMVGIMLERSLEMVTAMVGVLKAGGAYVPLDPAFPGNRIEYMAQDAALSVIVTQQSLADRVPRVTDTVVLDTNFTDTGASADENLPPNSDPNSLAYVIYTSGSTGQPKGVELEHRSVVNFLLSMHKQPGITPEDRLVAVTTLSFDIAGLEILGPLTAGACVIVASRATALSGESLSALLEAVDATILQATPATWRLLLESGWQGRPGLRMLCGGERLPTDLADSLLQTRGELWNMYGPTETTIWSTVGQVTDTKNGINLGQPIANTSLYILEANDAPAPIGVPGELCIGGAGLARGYHNRPELTAAKFAMVSLPDLGTVRVYRTGDMVRRHGDGRMTFIGRRDEQVKVRGYRIELGEIETVLATDPHVNSCAVIVREDSPGDQRLVAYLVESAPGAFDIESARALLRTALPEYMLPNLFEVLPALPLTPNAKIDRKALPAPVARVEENAAASVTSDAMMSPEERRVARWWRDVLKTDAVGLHANFFDSGGHSLLLVKLQVALNREFGMEVPLVEFFQRTTIAAQAARYVATDGSTGDSALERAQRRAARLRLG